MPNSSKFNVTDLPHNFIARRSTAELKRPSVHVGHAHLLHRRGPSGDNGGAAGIGVVLPGAAAVVLHRGEVRRQPYLDPNAGDQVPVAE